MWLYVERAIPCRKGVACVNRSIVTSYKSRSAARACYGSLMAMAAYDSFQTAMASAASLFAGGDYDGARRQIIVARMYLAQIPNSSADGTSAQWREDLAALEGSITMESGRTTRSVSVCSEFS